MLNLCQKKMKKDEEKKKQHRIDKKIITHTNEISRVCVIYENKEEKERSPFLYFHQISRFFFLIYI